MLSKPPSRLVGHPKPATNVRIPQGYGCDPTTTAPATPAPVMPHPSVGSPSPLRSNIAAVSSPSRILHQATPPTPSTGTPPWTETHVPPCVPTTASISPFARTTDSSIQPMDAPPPGPPDARAPTPAIPTTWPPTAPSTLTIPDAIGTTTTSTPHAGPLHANVASMADEFFPPPTQDDLIAAGMRYFATQTGSQDFQ